jgi:outer membrane lipoprotein-sorting protein
MNRRSLLAALAVVPVLALPAHGQGINVATIDTYLRGLRSAEGRFRQLNPNGSTQTGRFMLQKPGRIRFEYDTPTGSLVIADGTNVGVFDPRSNRNPTRYPLARTPLSLLLRDNLSLREPGMVLGATRDANGTHITVTDPRQPHDGRMVMTFSENPVRLREWVVQTAQGQRTRVSIIEMQTGVQVASSLFNIELAAANYTRPRG